MRRWVTIAAALALAAVFGTTTAHDEPALDEVRAAFLYRFMFFVRDVPETDPDGRLCLGVLGPTPLTELLREVDGRRVRGRDVEVRRFDRVDDVDLCELVYISPELDGGAEPAARALAGRGILTVSTEDGFARRGGVIELSYQRDRVRFDVNRSTARANGVHLNAELLEVARRVYQ